LSPKCRRLAPDTSWRRGTLRTPTDACSGRCVTTATTGDGALWFWARILRRDLVDLCKDSRGSVLLTCRVLWERVLVSQFAGWQAVLNGSPSRARPAGESDANYVARLERIFDDFEVRQKAAGAPRQPVGGSPVDLRADLERTWEHILDPRNFQPFWRLADHHARPPAPEDGRTTKPVTAHRGDVGAR
jgi:hypothetical protein